MPVMLVAFQVASVMVAAASVERVFTLSGTVVDASDYPGIQGASVGIAGLPMALHLELGARQAHIQQVRFRELRFASEKVDSDPHNSIRSSLQGWVACLETPSSLSL